mmetsp:Transcript_851/g.2480  ORF Transcript_851/g.2480 Transcript_851/m.2480 type:complete len:438 (-) Transcript_851:321-1634(-)
MSTQWDEGIIRGTARRRDGVGYDDRPDRTGPDRTGQRGRLESGLKIGLSTEGEAGRRRGELGVGAAFEDLGDAADAGANVVILSEGEGESEVGAGVDGGVGVARLVCAEGGSKAAARDDGDAGVDEVVLEVGGVRGDELFEPEEHAGGGELEGGERGVELGGEGVGEEVAATAVVVDDVSEVGGPLVAVGEEVEEGGLGEAGWELGGSLREESILFYESGRSRGPAEAEARRDDLGGGVEADDAAVGVEGEEARAGVVELEKVVRIVLEDDDAATAADVVELLLPLEVDGHAGRVVSRRDGVEEPLLGPLLLLERGEGRVQRSRQRAALVDGDADRAPAPRAQHAQEAGPGVRLDQDGVARLRQELQRLDEGVRVPARAAHAELTLAVELALDPQQLARQPTRPAPRVVLHPCASPSSSRRDPTHRPGARRRRPPRR